MVEAIDGEPAVLEGKIGIVLACRGMASRDCV